MDQFARPSVKRLRVYGNRGASGIDGVVSSALGVAAGRSPSRPTVLLIGDISFYHDLNGLLAVKQKQKRQKQFLTSQISWLSMTGWLN